MDLTGIGSAADSIMGGLDKLFTSDDERSKNRAAIVGQLQSFQLGMQGELSKRHAADMVSDNRLSKNIRPIMLIASFALHSGAVIAKMCGVDVPDSVVWSTGGLAGLAFGFYFGGRTGEKLMFGRLRNKQNQDE